MVFDSMDREELRVTAHLARLELSKGEAERFELAVLQMLDYFSKMKDINVQGLTPTTQLARDNRLREDTAIEGQDTDSLLKNAPELENRFVVIPNVL